ncbi:MAG: monovalent cation:proton antiporter-2 (CPA2) family protein [Hyphomicrobiales bacterium]|nr:monovalent cation:proton antiporter-2 (CPA2) family protein [Hyphomicrobiales bacterium]
MADASHASFLPPILTFCAGAVVAVPLFRRFGLSAVLGYLAAGVVIGPSVLKVITDADSIRGIAEIGVVLLLFIVGLELQPSRLIAMRKDIFGAGSAQLGLTALLVGLIALAMGLSWQGAVAVGIAMGLSATAIALQLLEERGDQDEHYGRRTFSILLFQDMAIAPILALLPLAATTGAGGDLTKAALGVGLAVAAIAAVVVAGKYVLNPAFRLLAKSGAREVMTAAALLVVLGSAVLMEHVGLSMALGAFLAGVLLAESNFRHELEADIEPFRGVLLGLFFMAVGMSIDLRLVMDNWLLLALAAPALVLLKIAVAAGILRASCSSTAEAIRAGALLSPAGEFAFVLLPLAGSLSLLTQEQAAIATALAAITMLIGPIIAKMIDAHLAKNPVAAETMDEDFNGAGGSVVIIGFGRFGQVVTQTMLTQKIDVTVIDKEVERIKSAARFGFKIFYGDGTRLDVLRAAGAGKAKVIAVCVDDRQAAKRITEIVKQEFPQARVHVRAYDRVHAIELMGVGVDRFVRETFESALYFGRITLEVLGLSPDEAATIVADVRKRDLQRLEAQATDGILARTDLLRGTGITLLPEPLVKPQKAGTALNEETRAAVGQTEPQSSGAAS